MNHDRRNCEPLPLSTILHRMGIGEGRPERDCQITKTEIIDLKILLNTTNTVEAFLQRI